ncbi:MAG: PAS domain-containing protein [Sneathiella sp.]|nr:PAS domain-containing protein [Sneathiella sp.]
MLLLALGGAFVASIGLWITYTTITNHFEQQLVERGRLLISSLNHTSMVVKENYQIQHIVDELTSSPLVNNIMVVNRGSHQLMAASDKSLRDTSLGTLSDKHLKDHLIEVLESGFFGYHFDYEKNEFILTMPLDSVFEPHQPHTKPMMKQKDDDRHAVNQQMRPEHGGQDNKGSFSHTTTSQNGVMKHKMNGASIPLNNSASYRGVILLVLDNNAATAASIQILWLLCIALVAAVLIMMSIAYVIVDRQILDRIAIIRNAMMVSKSDENTTFISINANDEISDLGRAFNGMVARIDAETSKREKAVLKLKVSEERFKSVIENAPAIIHIKDAEGRFILINSMCEKLFGVQESEILGKKADEIFSKEFSKEIAAHDQIILETGQTHAQEEKWNLNNKEHTFLSVKFPIQDGFGENVAIGVIGTDITVRKLAEDAIQSAFVSENANKMKTHFLANMSHELRTPLNSIIGFSEIMKEERLGPVGSTRYREYAVDINESGLHLLSLINDILDLSKIEAGAEKLYEENLEISATVKSVTKTLTGLLNAGKLDLKFDFSENMPILRADARRVRQILLNLLSNAIKFTPAGGTVEIKTWMHANGDCVLQVIDSGIGIALADIQKALTPFQQIDSDLNRKHNGTGLGLPLTKSLVEMHGGYMDLKSELGVGTSVTVHFPANRAVSPSINNLAIDKALKNKMT